MKSISDMNLAEVTLAILGAAVNIPDGMYARAQHLAKEELRALLDESEDKICSVCNGFGRYQDGGSVTDEDGRCPNIVDCDCGDSERIPEYRAKPAARSQGEPVAYTTAGMLEIAKRLPLTGRIGAKATKDERWNIPLFLGQGEQPAPVAVPHTMKSIMEAVEASRCYTVLTSDQCHALAQVLNGVKV